MSKYGTLVEYIALYYEGVCEELDEMFGGCPHHPTVQDGEYVALSKILRKIEALDNI